MTFCAEVHPFDDAVLCRRVTGHAGVHASDPGLAWHTCPPGCPCHRPDPGHAHHDEETHA